MARGNRTECNTVFPLRTRSQAGIPASTITTSSGPSSPASKRGSGKRLGFSRPLKQGGYRAEGCLLPGNIWAEWGKKQFQVYIEELF